MKTVNEVQTKVYMKKSLTFDQLSSNLEKFIVQTLSQDPEMLKIHTELGFKPYCWGWLQPVERDGVYKEGEIYSFRLRTIDAKLADYLQRTLSETSTHSMKGLVSLKKTIPFKYIESLYSITPIVIKIGNDGYWKNNFTIKDFENQIKTNLFKKYKDFIDADLDESMPVFNYMEITNRKPFSIPYKTIHLLGDKVNLGVDVNPTAQKLAYLSLGCGLGVQNSSGFGFMGYKY